MLFILPAGAINWHWRRCGLSGPEIDPGFTACVSDLRLPRGIRKLIDSHPDEWSSVLSRLKLAAISWNDLQDCLQRVANDLDQSLAGDQTLYRLIEGFLAQLKLHRDTGIDTGQS
ncbi:MAG: hypothetical protein KDK07_22305 [Bauldia sp.]|nr:hypothetical protein [Bauldia sp.]